MRVFHRLFKWDDSATAAAAALELEKWRSKPWGAFFDASQLEWPQDVGQMSTRFSDNADVYRGNYASVGLAIVILVGLYGCDSFDQVFAVLKVHVVE